MDNIQSWRWGFLCCRWCGSCLTQLLFPLSACLSLLPIFKLANPLPQNMKSLSIINRLPQAFQRQGPCVLHDSKDHLNFTFIGSYIKNEHPACGIWRNQTIAYAARLHISMPGLQPLFKREKATAACAVAQPQDMSSGTQLSDLIRNRVEFGDRTSPPPTSTDCKHW